MAIRTVRNGSVRIACHIYRPNELHRKYNHELEGLRLAFGLYWIGKEFQPDFVSLWGTEAMYRGISSKNFGILYRSQPNLIDGRFYWEWWDNVNRRTL